MLLMMIYNKQQSSLTIMSRVNQTTLPQGVQTKKIFCAYHPNEFLTNFCCDANCLMPLCPNCIVQHTQQHFLEGNRPIYVNLQEIIAQTKQKCYQNIVMFEELNKNNDRIFDYLMGLRESIHNQLQEDKQEIIEQLNSMFQAYEDKLFEEATTRYKEMSVYNKKETTGITDYITEQIQNLHDLIAILKGDNCLAGLITYYSNDSKIYEESIKELNQYVAKHKEAGKISINIDSQKLIKTFENFCSNNIAVQYINEDSLKEKVEQEAKINESRTNKELKTIMSKMRRKEYGSGQYKQNLMSQSNNQYKNTLRKLDDYYKIDVKQGQHSQFHQQKFPFPSSYFKSHQSIWQQY